MQTLMTLVLKARERRETGRQKLPEELDFEAQVDPRNLLIANTITEALNVGCINATCRNASQQPSETFRYSDSARVCNVRTVSEKSFAGS